MSLGKDAGPATNDQAARGDHANPNRGSTCRCEMDTAVGHVTTSTRIPASSVSEPDAVTWSLTNAPVRVVVKMRGWTPDARRNESGRLASNAARSLKT